MLPTAAMIGSVIWEEKVGCHENCHVQLGLPDKSWWNQGLGCLNSVTLLNTLGVLAKFSLWLSMAVGPDVI